MHRKIRQFRTDKFNTRNTESLTHATHVNGWEPAVNMSYMSQTFRLFHVTNLSVRNFRIFLLMYPGSRHRPDSRHAARATCSDVRSSAATRRCMPRHAAVGADADGGATWVAPSGGTSPSTERHFRRRQGRLNRQTAGRDVSPAGGTDTGHPAPLRTAPTPRTTPLRTAPLWTTPVDHPLLRSAPLGCHPSGRTRLKSIA